MRYLEDAVTLQYDQERCNGCGLCARVCPHTVFAMVEKRAVLADRGACMECGACAKNCAQKAIRVRAGMGCAAGLLSGMMAGTEGACGCSGDSSCC
jgi:NAD-dependent dihydropyrimidine dehydrogenase PreA subunit